MIDKRLVNNPQALAQEITKRESTLRRIDRGDINISSKTYDKFRSQLTELKQAYANFVYPENNKPVNTSPSTPQYTVTKADGSQVERTVQKTNTGIKVIDKPKYPTSFVDAQGYGFSARPEEVITKIAYKPFGQAELTRATGKTEIVNNTGLTQVYGKTYESDNKIFTPQSKKSQVYESTIGLIPRGARVVTSAVGEGYVQVGKRVIEPITKNKTFAQGYANISKKVGAQGDLTINYDVARRSGETYSQSIMGLTSNAALGLGTAKGISLLPTKVTAFVGSKPISYGLNAAFIGSTAYNVASSPTPIKTAIVEGIGFYGFNRGLKEGQLLFKSKPDKYLGNNFKPSSKVVDIGKPMINNKVTGNKQLALTSVEFKVSPRTIVLNPKTRYTLEGNTLTLAHKDYNRFLRRNKANRAPAFNLDLSPKRIRALPSPSLKSEPNYVPVMKSELSFFKRKYPVKPFFNDVQVQVAQKDYNRFLRRNKANRNNKYVDVTGFGKVTNYNSMDRKQNIIIERLKARQNNLNIISKDKELKSSNGQVLLMKPPQTITKKKRLKIITITLKKPNLKLKTKQAYQEPLLLESQYKRSSIAEYKSINLRQDTISLGKTKSAASIFGSTSSLRFKQTPILKQAQAQRYDQKSIYTQANTLKQTQIFKRAQVYKQTPILKQTQRQAQAQRYDFTQIYKQGQRYKTPAFTVPSLKIPPNKPILNNEKGFKLKFNLPKSSSKKGSNKYGYSASIEATLFNVKGGKKNKLLENTGLVLRPLRA